MLEKGQYHFVYILAPKKSKKFAAFVVGWMNLLAWCIALCSGVAVIVASIAGIIAFLNESYEPTPWQLYMIYFITTTLSGKGVCIETRQATDWPTSGTHVRWSSTHTKNPES